MMNYTTVKQILQDHSEAHRACQDAINKIKEHKLKQKALYREFYQAQKRVQDEIELMKQQDPAIAEGMAMLSPSTNDILYQPSNPMQ